VVAPGRAQANVVLMP